MSKLKLKKFYSKHLSSSEKETQSIQKPIVETRSHLFTDIQRQLCTNKTPSQFQTSSNDEEQISKYFKNNKVVTIDQLDESDEFVTRKTTKKPDLKLTAPDKNLKIKKQRKKNIIKNQQDIRSLAKKSNDLIKYSKDFGTVCNKGGIDVDPEQLQLAIALSESLQDCKENSCDTKTLKENIECNVSDSNEDKVVKIKKTLEQFGFRVSTSVSLENNTIKKRTRRRKRCNYILINRSVEQKRQVIADKVSEILVENVSIDSNNLCFEKYRTASRSVEGILCERSCYFSKCCSNYKNLLDGVYNVPNLVAPSSSKVGCLLKDWSTIPGREKSPERENVCSDFKDNTFIMNHLDVFLSGTMKKIHNAMNSPAKLTSKESVNETCSINKDSIESVKNEIKILEFDRCESPDLFADSYMEESRSENIESENLQSPEVEDELPDVYISQPYILKNNEKLRNDCSMRKIKSCSDIIVIADDITSNNSSPDKTVEDDKMYVSENGIIHYESFRDISISKSENEILSVSPNITDNENNFESSIASVYTPVNEEIDLTQSDDEIEDDSILTNKIENNSILADEIEDNSIFTDKIENNSILADKIDDNSILTNKIENNSILTNGIEDNSIPVNEIEDNSIPANEIEDNFILTNENCSNVLESSQNNKYTSLNEKFDNSIVEININNFNCSEGNKLIVSQDSQDEIFVLSDDELNYSSATPFRNMKSTSRFSQFLDNSKEKKIHIQEPGISLLNDCSDNDEEAHNYCNPSIANNPVLDNRSSECTSIADEENENIIPNNHSKWYRSSIFDPISSDSLNIESSIKKEEIVDESSITRNSLPDIHLTGIKMVKDVHTKVEKSPMFDNVFSNALDETIVNSKETPNRSKYVIKTKNVTPMMDYNSMGTPKIVKELSKFGIRPLKRKRAIQMLEHIYEQTHPLVDINSVKRRKLNESNAFDCGEFQKSRNSAEKCQNDIGFQNETITLVKPQTEHNVLSENVHNTLENTEQNNTLDIYKQINNVITIKQIDCQPEDWIFQTKEKKKVQGCRVPLHVAFYNYLSTRTLLREAILKYEPIEIEKIHRGLKDAGYTYKPKDLMDFLDKKCITIKTTTKNPGPRKPPKR